MKNHLLILLILVPFSRLTHINEKEVAKSLDLIAYRSIGLVFVIPINIEVLSLQVEPRD